MTFSSIVVVGSDAQAVKTAQEAGQFAFSPATVKTMTDLDEAVQGNGKAGAELLLLANPSPADVEKAEEAIGIECLCQWPEMIWAENSPGKIFAIVVRKEWDPHLAAQIFQSAVAQYTLMRENVRLRDDLRTVVTRISHDLRTPLCGIVITCEALTYVLADHAPAHRALAQAIIDSTDEMAKLIERVAFLLRTSTNTHVNAPVDMAKILFATRQRLESWILKKGATVIEPPSWPEVDGVQSWLETVWWNLMMNALQHAGEAVRIEIGWQKEEEAYRFWIRDNGVGVADAKRSALFQPFHSLHQRNSTHGLGLAIVQRLVELQGGNCGYEPVAEGGSCFSFTLPLSQKPPGWRVSHRPSPVSGAL